MGKETVKIIIARLVVSLLGRLEFWSSQNLSAYREIECKQKLL